MADRLTELTTRVDGVHGRYRANFAGQSRATRDLALLDSLIVELQDIKVKAGANGDGGGLLGRIGELEDLYRKERAAIADVKAGGPAALEAHRLGEWTTLATHRYRRNFAGHRRSTRDLGLLRQLVSEQRAWQGRLLALAAQKEADWMGDLAGRMTDQISLYERELGEIPKARASLSDADLARVMATLANGQFGLYRTHFQGQQRRSRRPALLERSLESLREILAEMQRLRDAGVATEAHLGNIQKVTDRIDLHEKELIAVKRARAQTKPTDLLKDFADEANGLFKKYRENFANRKRTDVDAALLHDICEQLHAVARQMDDLHRQLGDSTNANNLTIVVSNLVRYEREHQAILEAQKPQTS